MSYSNVSVKNGELIFGGTVASTGGVAHGPLALGKMRRAPRNDLTNSSNNNNVAKSHSSLSQGASTLPARASLKVAPPKTSSSLSFGTNYSSNDQQNINNNRKYYSSTPTASLHQNAEAREDSIDNLLAKSRAAAPTPNQLNSSTASALGGGNNGRSSTPQQLYHNNSNHDSFSVNPRLPTSPSNNNNNNSLSSSSAFSPNNGRRSVTAVAHRAALEPTDFDVTTEEAIPLHNKSRAAALEEDGGNDGVANNPNNPASRTATASGKPLHVPYAPTIRSKTGVVDVMTPLCLKDYVLLADACKRAGRARVEGTAYFKIAHLLSTTDEEQKPKAIVYLRKYLQICRRINDLQGEAKALNALGIIHYELAVSTCTPETQQSEELLRIALGFHRQHAEIADAAGIFIANTNAGLCHAQLGDHVAAAESHKLAASFAVQAGDRDAEALALSNLAAAATSTGDHATSRLCAQRQLDVGNATHNAGVTCEAQEQLAQLAIQRNDYPTATTHLVSALEIALKEGDQRRALRLRCLLGVAQAANGIENKMQNTTMGMKDDGGAGGL